MADRRVTHTRKATDGTIGALCNPGSTWSPRMSRDAIKDIENKWHTYFVDRAGHRADIHVAEGPSGKYLRTDADETSANNLHNLPNC